MGLTRAFVAIGLPAPVRDALGAVADAVPGGRTVGADNLHVTLAFLDALDDRQLEGVHDALSVCRAPGFQMRIDGLGQFGGGRPRSLWAGVSAGPALSHLQAKTTSGVRSAGVALPRRKFVPHVTLARFRGGREKPDLHRFISAHAGLQLGPFDVRAFGLYASHRGRAGADYEELTSYPLDAPGTG